MKTYYENILGEEQNGFRKGCSCCDGYFTMKLLIEKHREFNVEIRRYKKSIEIINSVMKPSLVQKHTHMRLYKTLQIKGKESENSYQELKRSQKDRHTRILFVCACPFVISSIPGKSFHFPCP